LDRRNFLALAAAAPAMQLPAAYGQPHDPAPESPSLNLEELRQYYHQEMFETFLPFWDKHGIDREYGGFLCGLDYDGTRASTDKFIWFQGRGIWVYSFLYNHFDKNPGYLEIARRTKDFLLKYAPLPNGWWATSVSQSGSVLIGEKPDIYAMLFGAEGLQEYAYATQDEQARQVALNLIRKVFHAIDQPNFQIDDTGPPGTRQQGAWMLGVQIATQMLRREDNPELRALADRCVDAIINKHYNPEIGLNNEHLNFDFSRSKEDANRCLPGVCLETLWMVMEEANRRKDQKLWDTCADRVRRHFEVGWDWVFGGLNEWVNVDHGDTEWLFQPTSTNLEFREKGEYFHLKSLWALNEALIATLAVFEKRPEAWAANYFDMTHQLIQNKYSQRKRGLPGYMLFADRHMIAAPHVARQDNYHPPRQMMHNLLALNRMLGRSSTVRG
jgi:N-acylglucosamine 2-epimerase